MISLKERKYLATIIVTIIYTIFLWWTQDDFYIHLQYAKNFSKTFIWSFNAGIPSYGTTSPLWIVLLSLFGAFNIDLIIAAKLMSVFFGVVSFFMLYNKAEKFCDIRVLYLFIISIAFNHWYQLAAGSGMEATLASLCITILYLRTYNQEDSKRYSLVNGILIGLCILVRPEFLYLLFLFLIKDLLRIKRLKTAFMNQTMTLLGAVIILMPWVLFAEWQFHSIIPATVMIKTGRYIELTNVFNAIIRVSAFYLSSSFFEVLLGIVFIIFVIRKKIVFSDQMILRGAILIGIPAIYLFNQFFGGASITYRYAAPMLPILIFAAYKYFDILLFEKKLHPQLYRFLFVSISLCIILPNILLTIKHVPYLKQSDEYLLVLEKYGKYLKENARNTDSIACYDIGAIGYYSDKNVLDLVGLVSQETIKYQHGDLFNTAAIETFKPTYVVVPWFADMYGQLSLYPKGVTIFKDSVCDYRFQIAKSSNEHRYINELRKIK